MPRSTFLSPRALSTRHGARAVTAAALIAAAAGTAWAGPPTAADKKFVHDAAIGGMVEVTLGKMAQEQGSNAGVKAFGERMVTDHGKANEDLKALASAQQIPLPEKLDAKAQKTADKLGKLSGPAFDKAYMSDMVKDHKKDIADFEKTDKSTKDVELKAFTSKTLPTLEAHLKMAESAAAEVHAGK